MLMLGTTLKNAVEVCNLVVQGSVPSFCICCIRTYFADLSATCPHVAYRSSSRPASRSAAIRRRSGVTGLGPGEVGSRAMIPCFGAGDPVPEWEI